MSGLFVLFGILILAAIYFAPSVVAIMRKRDNFAAIFALNFFLGWSLIGWVVSLVWALSNEQKQQTIVIQQGGKDN